MTYRPRSAAKRLRDKGVTPPRQGAQQRGYTRKWQKLSRWYLANNPFCAVCGRPAEEVDHIQPKRRGGTDDPDNLQSLCKPCHSKKTVREQANGREGGQKL